ncbi:hypothetical protein DIPPA_70160 [Diplonema papillatum]|nr:hypothetical protein DIPPA_70160 [Diplonema papillatum]
MSFRIAPWIRIRNWHCIAYCQTLTSICQCTQVSSSKAEANQLRAEAFSWHRQVEANEMMKQKQLAAQQTVTYQLQAQVEQSRKSTQHLETWCFSLQQELRTARKQLSEKDRQLAQMSKNFEALRRDMKFDADLADKDPGRQVNASSCVREPMPPQRSSTHRKPASQVAVPRRSPASCRSFLPRTPSPQPSTRCTTPIEPYVLPLEPTYKTVNVLVY